MLHLFTGLPGSQKTANMLHYVLTRINQKGKGSWSGRPVYFYNIKGLNEDGYVPLDGWIRLSEDEFKKWYELPEGSIILCDEAQKVFRPGGKNDGTPPKHITELEEHRHSAFDILLTTQHPMLIHTAVRRQVQFYWHLERPFGMKTKALTWEKCHNDPDDHFSRKEAAIQLPKVPSHIFQHYKSTAMDTHKKRIPKKLFIILGAISFVIIGVIVFVSRFSQTMGVPDSGAAGVSAASGSVAQDLIKPAAKSDGTFQPKYPLDPERYKQLFQPRIPSNPATAPVYDDLMEPVVAPRTLCYSFRKQGADHCQCVTQQMTPIPMAFAQCKNIVDEGMWDPTLKPASYSAKGELVDM